MELEVAGVEEVAAAFLAGAVGERVLEEDEEGLGRQPLAHGVGHMAEEPPRGRKGEGRARAVVGDDAPAVQLGRHTAGQHPVGRDERGGRAVLGCLAEAGGDGERLGVGRGRFEQGQTLFRGRGVAEAGAFGHPLVGDGRGPEGEGDEAVARRRGGHGVGPGPYLGRRHAEARHQAAEAVLRMVFGRERVLIEVIPCFGGHVEVEPRQDEPAVGKPRHQRHEGGGGAARSGGARDDHGMRGRRLGPAGGEAIHREALAALGVGGRVRRFEVAQDDVEEGAAAAPVIRGVGIVDPRDLGAADPFALHLVEERREAVGEVVEGRARGEIRVGIEERLDEPREFKVAPDGGDGRLQVRVDEIASEVFDERDGGQEARPASAEERRDPAFHAAGVHP
jgi:hypothetical protein